MDLDSFKSWTGTDEYKKRLRERFEVNSLLLEGSAEANKIKEICSQNGIYFVENFGWTYEPRYEKKELPFFMWDYQIELFRKIQEAEEKGEDLFIEKVRDMGVSWTFIWYCIWRFTFKYNWNGLIGSRNQAECDNGTIQSLFGKFRYGLYSLPLAFKPDGFSRKRYDNRMKIVNSEKSSLILGETANPNFGRGKRINIVFMDECFFWMNFKESFRSLADSTKSRILISTTVANSYAKQLKNHYMTIGLCIELGWQKHPFKTEKWFKAENIRRSFDETQITQELERSYGIEMKDRYYPMVEELTEKKSFEHNQDIPLYISLDFGAKDNTDIIWWQMDKSKIYCLESIEANRKNIEWFLPYLNKDLPFDEKKYLSYYLGVLRKVRTWKKPVAYFGEAAHWQAKMPTNESEAYILSKNGIKLMANYNAIKHIIRRNAVIKILDRIVFNEKSIGVMNVFDALCYSRFSARVITDTTAESMIKPVHDSTADMRSAVENFASNYDFIYRDAFLRIKRDEEKRSGRIYSFQFDKLNLK